MVLKVVDLVKNIVTGVVSEGDTVVDATVGNGHDTLFLADLVGEKGKVFGFDIQEQAIKKAHGLLKARGLEKRVKLICDSHQNMDRYIHEGIKAAVFNLGYLPGGSHDITTHPETTLMAVEKSIEILLPGGIITIAVYRGHKEGQKEETVLNEYLRGLDSSIYISVLVQAVNQGNNPPVLWAVQKKLGVRPTNNYRIIQ
jgi:predicted methyltransferase